MTVLLLAGPLLRPTPGSAAGGPGERGWEARLTLPVGSGSPGLAYEAAAQDRSLAVSDLGLAPDGRAFIADAGAGRLLVFSPAGSVEVEFPFPPGLGRRLEGPPRDRPAPRFFTVSFSYPTGEAYLIDVASGEVHVYGRDWKRVRGFVVSGFAVSPKSLVVLRNGEIRLHDPGKGKIFLLSAEGQLLGATRSGRASLAGVQGAGSAAERELVGLGETNGSGLDLLAVDGYGAEPPRKLGAVRLAREGADLHVLPHPVDASRFAFVEAGPRPGDPIRVTLCRFVPAGPGGARFEAAPVLAIAPPPQADLVPLLPFRLTAAGELVTFGQPDAGGKLQVLAHALRWPE